MSNDENPVVFFDVTVGGSPKGRIEMELRRDVVPKTAEVRRKKVLLILSRTARGAMGWLA